MDNALAISLTDYEVSEMLAKQKSEIFAQCKDFLEGGVVVEIKSNEEYDNLIRLGQLAKTVRKDYESEYDEKATPFNASLEDLRANYKPVIKNLERVEKNAVQVCGKWEIEQRRIAAEQKRLADEKKLADEKALAQLAQDEIEKEERLRKEATDMLEKADTAETEEERKELVSAANVLSASADTALADAGKAEVASQNVVAVKVETKVPFFAGFNSKPTFKANVSDYRKALKWLVDNNEYSALEGGMEALKKIVNSACNKIAKSKDKAMVLSGFEIVEDVKTRLDTIK